MIGKVMHRGAGWVIQRIGIDTIIPFSLITFMVLSFVFGLQNILLFANEGALITTACLALLTGWLLGRSRLHIFLSMAIASLAGTLFVVINTLKLWSLSYFLLLESIRFAWQSILTLTENVIPDTSPLIVLSGDIAQKLGHLMTTFSGWWRNLLSGVPNYDSEVTSLLWALALWYVASWAALCYRRSNLTLVSILPAGIIFAGSLSYSRGSTYFLVPFAGGLFLLLAWNQFYLLNHQWQSRQTDVAEDIAADSAMWVLAITTVVILFSLLFSLFSPQEILRTAREYAARSTSDNQEIGQALGLEIQASGSTSIISNDPGTLPRSHLIGSPPELSKQVALIIQINQPELENLDSQDKSIFQQLYFKSVIYDQYTGRGWNTSTTTRQRLEADDSIIQVEMPGQLQISQTIQFGLQPGSVLYHSGTPFKVSQPSEIEIRETPNETLDLYALTSQNTSDINNLMVDSLLPLTGETQLREANMEFPQWILDRYLQLPDDFPDQVRDLAEQITQDKPTPYDKARALEDFLRGYPYSLQIPPPPETGDISAYFLFDLKSGYCDYYATAMTVMARAAGIPARLVIGYTSGLYNQDEQRYIITEADAHSWVEIYFPGIGWIEFEPTAGIEGITRPISKPIERWDDSDSQFLQITPQSDFPVKKWLLSSLAVVGTIFLAVVIFTTVDRRRLTHLTPSQTTAIVYRRFLNLSKQLDVQFQPNLTPNELMKEYSNYLETQKKNSPVVWLLKEKNPKIREIIHNYNLASYSPFPLDVKHQEKIIKAWWSIRARLLMVRLWNSIRKRIEKSHL